MLLLPFYLADICCQHRNEENHSWVKTDASVKSVDTGREMDCVVQPWWRKEKTQRLTLKMSWTREMVANPRRRGCLRRSWEDCGLGVVVFSFHSHGRSASVLRAWPMLMSPSYCEAPQQEKPASPQDQKAPTPISWAASLFRNFFPQHLTDPLNPNSHQTPPYCHWSLPDIRPPRNLPSGHWKTERCQHFVLFVVAYL